MKTGRTQKILGAVLVVLQLLAVLFSALFSAPLLAWCRESFWHAILFCLPAILGLWLVSIGVRKRKEIHLRMLDQNQIDPWLR